MRQLVVVLTTPHQLRRIDPALNRYIVSQAQQVDPLPMPATDFQLFTSQKRSDWVRLRTLVALRWFAIIGQITAVCAATRIFGLQIEVGLAILVIMVAVIANILSIYIYPENKRLSETQATLWLVFDLIQLAILAEQPFCNASLGAGYNCGDSSAPEQYDFPRADCHDADDSP
jgi:hypothetical protein